MSDVKTKVVSLSEYLALITSEHNQRPKYMATVSLSVQPFVDGQNVALSLIGLFDLDSAVGQQLDFTGQWIGVSRILNLGVDPWFSFDTGGLGFDQGEWYLPLSTAVAASSLSDTDYRTLLYARVAANYWDGTLPGAYAVWNTLFSGTGYQIVIQDQGGAGYPNTHGNMEVTQAILGPPLTAVTRALFAGGYLGLKSAGVKVNYMIQSQPGSGLPSGVGLPLFGFDGGPPGPGPASFPPFAIAGFDMGAWGIDPDATLIVGRLPSTDREIVRASDRLVVVGGLGAYRATLSERIVSSDSDHRAPAGFFVNRPAEQAMVADLIFTGTGRVLSETIASAQTFVRSGAFAVAVSETDAVRAPLSRIVVHVQETAAAHDAVGIAIPVLEVGPGQVLQVGPGQVLQTGPQGPR